MNAAVKIAGAVALTLVLAACVAGSAESQHAAAGGWIAQLALGFWHGLIAPLMLICEVINKFAPHLLPWQQVRFYEIKAAGVAYDVGFYVGLAGSPVAFLRMSRRRN